MALGNNSNAIYLSISNGKICRSFQNKTANSIERVNKNGRTVHEEHYDFVHGVIKSVTTKDSEYGKFWLVELEDEGEKYNLQFQYSSGYANGFLMAFPNVDLAEPVKLIPSAKKEGDKTKTTLFINQNNEGVKWHWTKDNPGELPAMKQVKIKGQLTWDDSDKMDYLEQMVKDRMLNIFASKHSKPVVVNQQEDEDMPF